MNYHTVLFVLLLSALVASCASGGRRAPIVEGGSGALAAGTHKLASPDSDWRPAVYVVQKGDTLYSIAFNYGFDYHELAELNHIEDPSVISIGQEIRLFPDRYVQSGTRIPSETAPIDRLIKDQPKLVKYAYSAAAMAQIEKVQQQNYLSPDDSNDVATVQPAPEPKRVVDPPESNTRMEDDDSTLAWIMPAQGKVIGGFSEVANRKGIDIAGTLGAPVVASEAGKVVYSGSGLRGYGKLIIIKHNKTYLSAYAHNDRILVREGDNVTRGQEIAAMGRTDSDKVKLHFEVRRFGRPVDPARFLKLDKS